MESHFFSGSTRVRRAGYDPDKREVTCLFPDGVRWVYRNVSQAEWDSFTLASSPGHYLNTVLNHKPNHEA